VERFIRAVVVGQFRVVGGIVVGSIVIVGIPIVGDQTEPRRCAL
jgi:hypothetical protein